MKNLKEKKRVIVESSSEEDEEDFEGHEDKDIEETSGDEIEDESKNDDNDEVEEEEIEGEEDESEAEDNDAEDVESKLNNLGNEGSKKGEISYSDKSFEELGIGKWLTKQLNEYGLTRPTPVQGNCIPKILEGSDVLGCAKTGTGKTLAFALPILQKLAVDPYGVFAVILTPTRELATQISDQFIAFGRPLNLQVCTEKKKVIVESSSEEDEEDFEGNEDEDIEETSGDEIEDESKNDDNDEVEEEIEGEENESEAEDNDAEDVESKLNNLGNEGSKKGEISYSVKSFEELGIGKWLTKQLNEYGLTRPTPVQGNCIPKVLEGSDVLGCAKTGTGKTLAFALPILQKLAVDPYGVFAVILTPTRELATQISDQFIAFGRPLNLQVCTVTGGRDQMAQGNELARKPHVVVATPGRLADYIESDPITIGKLFKRIQFLVLDEADQMLDGPYAAQLKIIFQAMGKKRQTLLFSATITSALTKLHQVSIHKPYFFEDIDDVKTVEKLEQRYVLCPKGVKDAYLVYVVKNFYENRNGRSVLVFAHTCRECQALALMFKGLGFNILKYVFSALSDFRSKKIRILICTDVAARGLDVPHVDLVVNHNIPREPKTYVHRVGRSARAGRFGSSVAFVTQYDISLLRDIEKLVGRKLEKLPVSHKKVTTYVTDVLLLKREAEIKLERQKFGEQREIYKRKDLAMKGYSQEDIEKIMSDSKSRKRQPPVTSKMESLANRKTAKKRKA
uniref:RNA helicase n=1 Tax=Panagrolaimus sp. ES5 TaxID=591445 RepID=A0AC34EZZ0_9BILA